MTIRRPDDFHVHLRDSTMLEAVAPFTEAHFARALVMPNTRFGGIRTGEDVHRYREEIRKAAPKLEALMTVKLLDTTTPESIREAKAAGAIAAKLYPRGVTTNSEDGVSDPLALMPVYEAMEDIGMVLCLHGETPGVFCMNREQEFLRTLEEIARRRPGLKIVLEHVTTYEACEMVRRLHPFVAATITAHHLIHTLDDIVGDKLQPHHFCKPIPKTPADRRQLQWLAAIGHPKFFLGTDSAPHVVGQKECASGCAGVFSAPVALAVLAQVFEDFQIQELGDAPTTRGRFERFTSENGAKFYGLPLNEGTITLERKPWPVPKEYLVDEFDHVRPLCAGLMLPWQVVTS